MKLLSNFQRITTVEQSLYSNLDKWYTKHKFIDTWGDDNYFINLKKLPYEYKRLIPARVINKIMEKNATPAISALYSNSSNINNLIYNKKSLEKQFFKYLIKYSLKPEWERFKYNPYDVNYLNTRIPITDIIDNFCLKKDCSEKQILDYLDKWSVVIKASKIPTWFIVSSMVCFLPSKYMGPLKIIY